MTIATSAARWFGLRSAGPLRRTSPARRVLGVGTLVIVLIAVVAGAVAIRRRGAELVDAARELRTLDLLLAEEAGRSLQSVALLLDSMVEQVRSESVTTAEAFVERQSTRAVHDILRARVAGVPQLDAVTVISARGKLVNFSRGWPIPDVDLGDRDYFRYLRDNRTDEPYLTEPVVNRGSGTPTIYLVRRISAPDGTFIGLVLGAIELSYFQRLYGSLHLESSDFIALWRRDGILLARHPPAGIGQRMPPEAITSPETAWNGVPDVFEKTWTIDGGKPEKRLVASQAVAGFSMQVNIGRSEIAILADWRREMAAVGSAVVLAILCVAVLTWALVRRFHAYEAVAAASRDRERAVEARQQAEEALRQSQKMEALGQLTGGVAHDFNNLLTVVRSSADLLRRPNLTDERRGRYVEAIVDAAERASRLTAQLLAFSRRQALKPEIFDVARNVAAVAELVDRLTGSRVHVVTDLPKTPCLINADPNQFDTAVVNLAVNGRDAMPDGGRLTIAVGVADRIPPRRSHRSLPGAFVTVSVRDTGVGIPPEALERVFEPFFTTKKVGEGTGLGLSQVFGFAKQSGGDVLVESGRDVGTTFTLYLPGVDAAPTEARGGEPTAAAVSRPRGTRVLVVEDNGQVARTTIEMLDDMGFVTLWADCAERALAELDAGRDRFDIVFSDVVMPGMSGIDLGRAIRRRFADLPVVLTSGYSQDLVDHGSHGFTLVRKPYATEELLRALSEAAPYAGDARQEAAGA